jgi:outer membrane lipoprotein-sorting protein
MKKLFFSIGLVILGAFLLVGCAKDKVITETFPKKVEQLDSYILKGRLESFFPTGRKESEVTVSYKHPDYYRVELKMLGLNETQLIVKNKDGVYVLIPRINKTFKIEGSWPLNSSCSYLLQSLAKDIVNDPDIRILEEKDSFTVEVKAKLFNDANPTKQKIIFDKKTKLPSEVLVYDDNQNLMTRLTINTIDINPNISEDVFKVDKTIAEIRQQYGDESPTYEDRSFVYPTYFPEGSTLDQEVITGENSNRIAIMKFKGDEISFNVIQQYVNDQEAITTTYISGNILLVSGNVAIYGNDQLIFLENGIEYIIASSTIDFTEIYKMAESLVADTEK